MFIELTEILVCPACGPGHGLVAVVQRARERRILEGWLGCPACESRHPIAGGEVRLQGCREPPDGRDASDGQDAPDGRYARGGRREPPRDAAVRIAALLGLHERPGGYVLLGPGLDPAAGGVAGLGEGVEVMALGGGPGAPEEGVTRLRGAPPGALPIASGRLRGMALLGGGEAEVAEAARTLGPGGRLVVLRPGEAVRRVLEGLPLETLAEEAETLVAVRR